jgi:hypothetical protein
MYTRAMGYGCPDNAGGLCDSTYNGLFNQLYMAARQFQRYTAGVSGGYRAGIANNIQYNPDPDCGSTRVVIENQATANLYNYTPYQPNAAALAAGYGTGDGCSAYGNRNFWLHFTDWFGSTQTVGRDVDAPVGALDEVRTGVSTITVRGWTFDPNAPTQSIDVHVYVDGRFSTRMPANKPRPDVAAAFQGVGPATGYHGTVAAPPGQHTVCVYSVNTGRGYTNPLRGCRTVTVKAYVPKVPFGAQDSVAVSAHTVSVRGWVVDPDVPRSPVRVHMYVDGRWSGAVTADVARTDVALAYPSATANHGYEWSGTLPAGRHEVCAHAINLGAGTVNPRVGCRTVTLGGPPTGQLEDVTVAPGEVRIEGWAVDPDTVDPIRVQVYVDGAYHSSPLANGDRPDIAAARPGSGAAHGLDVTLPLASGERNVCLVAKNVLSGRPSHVPLGCRTVTVPATQFVPIGNLDSATVSGTTVTATGWALDQDSPTAALRVHVYVDGKSTTAWKIWADRGRADIELQYPEAGADHGFQLDLDLSSLPRGDHQVCAWAINILGGSSNTKLPCRTVRTS